jgi:hypothetical protein
MLEPKVRVVNVKCGRSFPANGIVAGERISFIILVNLTFKLFPKVFPSAIQERPSRYPLD